MRAHPPATSPPGSYHARTLTNEQTTALQSASATCWAIMTNKEQPDDSDSFAKLYSGHTHYSRVVHCTLQRTG
jgi:hypothetical protein